MGTRPGGVPEPRQVTQSRRPRVSREPRSRSPNRSRGGPRGAHAQPGPGRGGVAWPGFQSSSGCAGCGLWGGPPEPEDQFLEPGRSPRLGGSAAALQLRGPGARLGGPTAGQLGAGSTGRGGPGRWPGALRRSGAGTRMPLAGESIPDNVRLTRWAPRLSWKFAPQRCCHGRVFRDPAGPAHAGECRPGIRADDSGTGSGAPGRSAPALGVSRAFLVKPDIERPRHV